MRLWSTDKSPVGLSCGHCFFDDFGCVKIFHVDLAKLTSDNTATTKSAPTFLFSGDVIPATFATKLEVHAENIIENLFIHQLSFALLQL